jgi:hypothetical protein
MADSALPHEDGAMAKLVAAIRDTLPPRLAPQRLDPWLVQALETYQTDRCDQADDKFIP